MSSLEKAGPFVLMKSLLQGFDINDRINHFMLQNVAPDVWRASPPSGKGRTIAEIAGHIHNARIMWLKAVNYSNLPSKLEGEEYSSIEVIKAMKQSHASLREVLEKSFASDGRVKSFKPDAGSFFAYLIAHDSHHRGQITMLARQLGRGFPARVGYGMWEWNSR
jgi:uncharacterized damage-inducible protein DinB